MSKIESLKAQAENLKQALSDIGVAVTKGAALELIAKQYGFENWDTLCGMLNQPPKPLRGVRLSDLPFPPAKAWVTQDSQANSYSVEAYQEEGLALVYDEGKLRDFVSAYSEVFKEGLDSEAIYLFGDGHDVVLSFREMLNVRAERIGTKTNWHLADGKRVISFDLEPEDLVDYESFQLTVPKVTRSIKGSELIALRSHDGSFYDHFALVPPHLNVDTLRTKISEGLTALKSSDTANPDPEEEYMEEDVRKLVEALGCLWVASPHEIGQNWDC